MDRLEIATRSKFSEYNFNFSFMRWLFQKIILDFLYLILNNKITYPHVIY